jgi:hypothetical protein
MLIKATNNMTYIDKCVDMLEQPDATIPFKYCAYHILRYTGYDNQRVIDLCMKHVHDPQVQRIDFEESCKILAHHEQEIDWQSLDTRSALFLLATIKYIPIDSVLDWISKQEYLDQQLLDQLAMSLNGKELAQALDSNMSWLGKDRIIRMILVITPPALVSICRQLSIMLQYGYYIMLLIIVDKMIV